MNRKVLLNILWLLLLPFTYVSGQSPENKYYEGINHYSEGNFDQALSTWIELADAGFSSPELYYNIGNAAFKTGKIPLSILYYEKALLKHPFNEDIRYNLEIARSFVVDRFNTIPELFISRWFRMVSLLFSSNGWAVISLITFTLSLILGLLYLFSGSISIKRISFIVASVAMLISFAAISFSYGNRSVTVRNRNAIIFAPVVTGKSSPDPSGKDLFVIHEGTKVKVEDEVGGWYEIRLSDGNVGWIPVGDAEKI